MEKSKKVTVEFDITEEGVKTDSVKVFFNGVQADYVTQLGLTFNMREEFGDYSIWQELPKKELEDGKDA